MVMINTHGGSCCGMRHIRGFGPHTTTEELTRLVASGTRQYPNRNEGMIVEAVVTNSQCSSYPNVPRALKEAGFKLVSRFKNPNSKNICNVFHYNQSPRSLTKRKPSWLTNDMIAPQ